ncbi:MAG: hypothetical protein MUE70_12545 [Desulfobacterales bacterium]|jgi:hypothetical protein|nr:hypothetical protein [Desulfobacterales bacterium]
MNRKPGPQNPKKRVGNLEKRKRLHEILDQELISVSVNKNSDFSEFAVNVELIQKYNKWKCFKRRMDGQGAN